MGKPCAARRIAVGMVAAACCNVSLAQYKCVGKDGSITFQQQACSTQAQQQKLEIRSTAAPTPAAKLLKSAPERELEGMVADRERRDRQAEIAQIEDAIARRNQMMSNELDALRAKKPYAKNNLAGATWEQSISTEMQAVTQKYKTMNDLDLVRVAQLRAGPAKQ